MDLAGDLRSLLPFAVPESEEASTEDCHHGVEDGVAEVNADVAPALTEVDVQHAVEFVADPVPTDCGTGFSRRSVPFRNSPKRWKCEISLTLAITGRVRVVDVAAGESRVELEPLDASAPLRRLHHVEFRVGAADRLIVELVDRQAPVAVNTCVSASGKELARTALAAAGRREITYEMSQVRGLTQ